MSLSKNAALGACAVVATAVGGYLLSRQLNKKKLRADKTGIQQKLVTNRPYADPYLEVDVEDQAMFCAQCAQTKNAVGCYKIGKCGKTADVAGLQDELVQTCKAIGWYAWEIAQKQENGWKQKLEAEIEKELGWKDQLESAKKFIPEAMFTTLTNVNNDSARFQKIISDANNIRKTLEAAWKKASNGETDQTKLGDTGVLPTRMLDGRENANAASLCECLLYGLKGVCAYTDHSAVAGRNDEKINLFLMEALHFLVSPERHDLGAALKMNLRAGECCVWAMDLLNQSNKILGTPTVNKVPVTAAAGPGILVSGHDLHVLESLLQATAGTGINVYTHGEMLPAHSYPKISAHKHLAGHVGGAWNKQQPEFKDFKGPIVMTSNCIVVPLGAYSKRIWTFGPVGWPGVPHLGNRLADLKWNDVLAAAKASPAYKGGEQMVEVVKDMGPSPREPLVVGFGHDTVIGAAETVLAGVKGGLITRFFLIGGCDGDEEARSYYTELADNLPQTAVILTLGCGKYRISDAARKRLGNVGDTGIPRVLDIGQCNDTFSAVQIAVALAGALKCEVGDLPLSIVLSWLEQKAIAVLLACMHLGLKPLRVGPTLPAFLTQDVLGVLVKDFGVKVIGDPKKDIADMISASGMS